MGSEAADLGGNSVEAKTGLKLVAIAVFQDQNMQGKPLMQFLIALLPRSRHLGLVLIVDQSKFPCSHRDGP